MSDFTKSTDIKDTVIVNSTNNDDVDSSNNTFSSSSSGIIKFELPTRKILNQNDLNKFIESSIYKDILAFIEIGADAITGCKLDEYHNIYDIKIQ